MKKASTAWKVPYGLNSLCQYFSCTALVFLGVFFTKFGFLWKCWIHPLINFRLFELERPSMLWHNPVLTLHRAKNDEMYFFKFLQEKKSWLTNLDDFWVVICKHHVLSASHSKSAGDLFCQDRKLFWQKFGKWHFLIFRSTQPLQFKKYKVWQEEGFSNFMMENSDGQCIFQLFECEKIWK